MKTIIDTSEDGLPMPPDDLAKRVGGTIREEFLKQGDGIKQFIVSALPENYDFRDKRVLDFGCGVGRVLRHFQAEAQKGQFCGCDIDYQSIQWLSENFPSNFRVFNNSELPHLLLDSNYFDLVYVISVFTHLTRAWKPWMLELRRILKPGGIALITFHNRIAYEYNARKRFDEDNAGMLVMHEGRAWNDGGPMVYHSNQWIRKHWGQLFEIDYISREGLFNWQSLAFLIKPEEEISANNACQILQPYVYQFYNPDFIGQLDFTSRKSRCLKFRHGLELKLNSDREGTVSGWFASKAGKITSIKFVIDDKELMELLGTNLERPDVKNAYPCWPFSLHSGFTATLKLRGYAPGEYNLRVIAADSKKNRQELQIPLMLIDDY